MPRTRKQYKSLLPGALATLFILLVAHCCCRLPSIFFTQPLPYGQRRRVGRAAGEEPKDWQKALDKTFLDVDASPGERLEGFQELLLSPADVAGSVGKAVQHVAYKGLRHGPPDALDALFPQGTLARSEVEGLLAIARQAPEVIEDLQESAAKANLSIGAAASLDRVKGTLRWFLSDASLAEALNVFRSTPEGLKEPAFKLVGASKEYEVRQYPDVAVATRTEPLLAVEGLTFAEPFYSLVAYFLGSNEDKTYMNLTVPVGIECNVSQPNIGTMSFVLPHGHSVPAGGLPRPSDPNVELLQVPKKLVAIRRFPGVATAREARRVYENLLRYLAIDGMYEPVRSGQYSVLQYNPLYTLPWRRRNEIAVIVKPTSKYSAWNDTFGMRAAALPQERLEGSEVIPPTPRELVDSVEKALKIIAVKGFEGGHADALDALLPQGTLVRSDLEGLLALARQAPEVFEDLHYSATINRISIGTTPIFDHMKRALRWFLSDADMAEARNVLRSTPEGLEEPTFRLVSAAPGYEIRHYPELTVATRTAPLEAMDSLAFAEPFYSVAAYLFGRNENKTYMKMTVPVGIECSVDKPDIGTMSFVLPKSQSVSANGLPKPSDPSVELLQVPEKLVAIRRFPGVATAREVRREYERLLHDLARDGGYKLVKQGQYSVLQYNPLYTLPWRRRNEIAVMVAAADTLCEVDGVGAC